ncbi:hypothetical protein BXY66_1172 [Shimia isoporae]|uniref:Uncharacterized protein n=1 Tax=Shimia isoporae TaxID=647720 RepID=A0A4R1NMX1_9RHOB|nr:hypothetical protein [Shimia isoporae]TCL09129.1 hypothetical protein BXY66_1172 [Shimia isoporae]
MGRIAVVLGVTSLWPGLLAANDMRQLSGSEIADVLTDRTLHYETATQVFYASGRTLYNAGSDSWGYWQIQGDQYCSQWPPSGLWDCYDVLLNGKTVRFQGTDGSYSDGVYHD